MLNVTKDEIAEALTLSDNALIDMPNLPGIITPEMIVNLAGSILIANNLDRIMVMLSHKENPFIPDDYAKCLAEGKWNIIDSDPTHDFPDGKSNATCFTDCRVKPRQNPT